MCAPFTRSGAATAAKPGGALSGESSMSLQPHRAVDGAAQAAKRTEIVRLTRNEGMSRAEIARRLGTSPGHVRLVAKAAGLPLNPPRARSVFPPAKLAELAKLRAEGLSRPEIARRLGVGVNQIKNAVQRHNLPTAHRERTEAIPPADDYEAIRAAHLARRGFPKMMACLGTCGKPRMTHDPALRMCDTCAGRDTDSPFDPATSATLAL